MNHIEVQWQNALSVLLGLDESNFNMCRPAKRLNNDEDLWNTLNQIPKVDGFGEKNSFFHHYANLVQNVDIVIPDLKKEIGVQHYRAWRVFLDGQNSMSPHVLPHTFRQWAMMNAPSIANNGASILVRQNLVSGASAAIAPYLGDKPRIVDFEETLSNIEDFIENAASFKCELQINNINDTDRSLLTELLTGNIDETIEIEKLVLKADFGHLLVQRVLPGSWFNSSLMKTIYTNRGLTNSAQQLWENYFGENGILRILVTSMVVAEDVLLELIIHINVPLSEQLEISTCNGIWPLNLCESPEVSNTYECSTSTLVVRTRLMPGKPFVIGLNSLSINQYLGLNG